MMGRRDIIVVCAVLLVSLYQFDLFVPSLSPFTAQTLGSNNSISFDSENNGDSTNAELKKNISYLEEQLIDAQNRLALQQQRGSMTSVGVTSQPMEKTTSTDTTKNQVQRTAPVVRDFEHQEGGVIVSMIHGNPGDFNQLKQSWCLLKAAYDKRVRYDHLLFVTTPLSAQNVQELEEIVAPSKLTVFNNTKPLDQALQDLTPSQTETLLEMCNKTKIDEITWDTPCKHKNEWFPPTSVRYRWQAEFRSKHLWFHPALDNYKYLLWFDSDALCTRVWDQDPIATMARNGLDFMFVNTAGSTDAEKIHDRIRRSFGSKTMCGWKIRNGHMSPTKLLHDSAPTSECGKPAMITKIHGFFHVTNLDFFRSPTVLNWFKEYIGDDKYSRELDDQAAVTVPAVMLSGNRSWDMYSHGIQLDVMHNGAYDGKRSASPGWYKSYWANNATANFPVAKAMCPDSLIVSAG